MWRFLAFSLTLLACSAYSLPFPDSIEFKNPEQTCFSNLPTAGLAHQGRAFGCANMAMSSWEGSIRHIAEDAGSRDCEWTACYSEHLPATKEYVVYCRVQSRPGRVCQSPWLDEYHQRNQQVYVNSCSDALAGESGRYFSPPTSRCNDYCEYECDPDSGSSCTFTDPDQSVFAAYVPTGEVCSVLDSCKHTEPGAMDCRGPSASGD